MADDTLRQDALDYHRRSPPGKLAILPTKQLTNQRDLALAYSPGVAAACDEIVRDPREAFELTARGNLVGVVTNGTAVLGLGGLGAPGRPPRLECHPVRFNK
jgi:malate dehydrogenase (oxaloacetate-decarboxylating)(NADP+)